ncbi:gp74 [Alphaproteobacteria phage PhiJL001]|uniref:Gp74 n=1 Tax=Alphaproteobacteria phage PhiJL001 TaxID=2681607 RepID=Q5DN31_9CAUD|nr:gp74 [Alphaproteobacteria phage PhiJL001]AAT69474.1 gp74 [Alphaproteobacteria phage PhiJL001]
MKIDIDDREAQFICDAIDAFVKQHGLAVAGAGLTVVNRIQLAAKAKPPAPEQKEEDTDDAGS